ncbi:MAG: hypothetical protein D3910_28265 [Candidatus Electrothrix sp. ATG2]|nr:hypothetical protein [Candidatus Electrothrix sp. ATG2]
MTARRTIFRIYNTRRPHQSLGYRVPEDIHYC